MPISSIAYEEGALDHLAKLPKKAQALVRGKIEALLGPTSDTVKYRDRKRGSPRHIAFGLETTGCFMSCKTNISSYLISTIGDVSIGKSNPTDLKSPAFASGFFMRTPQPETNQTPAYLSGDYISSRFPPHRAALQLLSSDGGCHTTLS